MRILMGHVKKGTPQTPEFKRRAVQQVQDVIDSHDVLPRVTQTAREVMAALQAAGWADSGD